MDYVAQQSKVPSIEDTLLLLGESNKLSGRTWKMHFMFFFKQMNCRNMVELLEILVLQSLNANVVNLMIFSWELAFDWQETSLILMTFFTT